MAKIEVETGCDRVSNVGDKTLRNYCRSLDCGCERQRHTSNNSGHAPLFRNKSTEQSCASPRVHSKAITNNVADNFLAVIKRMG